MRAPEVWSGRGCFHRSDVWAFAVTVSHPLFPSGICVTLTGVAFRLDGYMPQGHWPQPWAMAKLLRLFPGSVTMHPTDANYQGYFRIAQLLERAGFDGGPDPSCFQTLSFEEELNKLSISPALAAFLRYLLAVDYMQRPTAAQALRSPQFKDLA